MNISKDTKILIRFDDICPTMNYDQFKRAEKLLDRYNVKPLIGVIPDCKDPDLCIENESPHFWEYVNNLKIKGYTIAMHGLNHVFDSKTRGTINTSYKSEFAGHSVEVQLAKLLKGREILEKHGIFTDIFFAPAHSYDRNTIRALKLAGFKYLSDGKSSKPYVLDGIKLLPTRNYNILRFVPILYGTYIFHTHEWVSKEKEKDFSILERLLNEHCGNIVTFDEYAEIYTVSTLWGRVDEYIYVCYERYFYPLLIKLYLWIKRIK